MKLILLLVAVASFFPADGEIAAAEVKVSEATQACIECHRVVHPGIVADWQRSRHAAVTPQEALGVQGVGRKVSSPAVPGGVGPSRYETAALRSPAVSGIPARSRYATTRYARIHVGCSTPNSPAT